MSGTYQAPEGWVGTLCTYGRDDDTHIATARAPARPSCSHPTPSSPSESVAGLPAAALLL